MALTEQVIRIRLKSYDHIILDNSCNEIVTAIKDSNSNKIGPIPLPTKRRIYCVLRSPHVNKDAREHFEIRTHRRIIYITDPSQETFDTLMKLDLPAGVDIEVKL